MEFTNNTSFPTLLHRAALNNDIIAMAVMCRITYDISEDGTATIAKEQEWKLHEEAWVHEEYGPMDTDNVYNKEGVDIMVFGSAKAPKGKTLTESEVSVSLNGKMLHRIKVFGNRVWKSFLGILSKSNPEPFTEIPLTIYNAFGGMAHWDGLEFPYSANPYGKGYYYTKDDAIGSQLPNIEHYDDLISKWNPWVDPAGVGALTILPLKAKYAIELDENNKTINKIKGVFFNTAFPDLIVDKVKIKDEIIVKGVKAEGDFKLKIPNISLNIDVSIGTKQYKNNLVIDQVGLITNHKQAFITYRDFFRYKLEPMEKRVCYLTKNN